MHKTLQLENVIKNTLVTEAEALIEFSKTSHNCAQAIQLITHSQKPLIVTGVGKSGRIGEKVASTFCSLGKPAIFVHAAEASHGDLGLIEDTAIILALSHSGESRELYDILAYAKRHDNTLIGLTGNAQSTLAKASNLVIAYKIEKEACLYGLAPTTSTTLMMAIGDSLAIGYSALSGKTPEDFKRYHPAGRLAIELSEAHEIMHPKENLPLLDYNVNMEELLLNMTTSRLGVGILMQGENVYGVISDGDLRRNAKQLFSKRPKDIATRNPVSTPHNTRAHDMFALMHEKGISQCLITQDGRLVGLVHILMLSALEAKNE